MIWVGRLILAIGGLLSVTVIRLFFKGNYINKNSGEVFLLFLSIVGITVIGVYLIRRAKGGKIDTFAKCVLQYILFYILFKLFGLIIASICALGWTVYESRNYKAAAKKTKTTQTTKPNKDANLKYEEVLEQVDCKSSFKNAFDDTYNYYNSVENLLSYKEFTDLSESLNLAISGDYNGRNWFEVAVISLYRGSDFDTSVYYLAHDGWNNLGQFEKDTCRRYFQNKVKESILLKNGLENTESNWQKTLQGLDFILSVNPELKRFINLVKENATEEELARVTEDCFCSGFVDWLKNKNDSSIDNIIRDIYARTEQGIARTIKILHYLQTRIYVAKNEQTKRSETSVADNAKGPYTTSSVNKKNSNKIKTAKENEYIPKFLGIMLFFICLLFFIFNLGPSRSNSANSYNSKIEKVIKTETKRLVVK